MAVIGRHLVSSRLLGLRESMLQQIGEQFMAGSSDYEAALGRRMEVENVGVKDIVAPLVSTVQGMAGEFRQMKEMVERMKVEQEAITRKVGEMRAGVTGQEVKDIVRREMVKALDGRNVSMTPQPDVKDITVQQNIQSLIQAGRLNDAFQTALSSNDLALVVFTCELLNTTQVFNSATCPLSQSVLLSLIQQLSVDLVEKTEVKHAYLHEALVNLDPENPTTKMHIRTVLGQLEQSLKKYIQANPNSKMTRNMKILSMAAGSHMQH
jgi:enhancer of mRNA-decapping protein 4